MAKPIATKFIVLVTPLLWTAWGPAGYASPKTELHVPICDATPKEVERHLELNSQDAKVGAIFYFDTKDLDYLNKGSIFRTKKPSDKKTGTTTVKVRPISYESVGSGWENVDGFRCEYDRTTAGVASSCRVKLKHPKDMIDAVIRGYVKIPQIYGSTQRAFVSEYSKLPVKWDHLRAYGPIPFTKWELELKNFPEIVDVEIWELIPNESIIEVSTRAEGEDVDRVMGRLRRLVERSGLTICQKSLSKTRTALEYLQKQSL
jgi:hypothetical protein